MAIESTYRFKNNSYTEKPYGLTFAFNVLAIFISLTTAGCTTQNFETPGVVYRLKLQNIGENDYAYRVKAFFYYWGISELVRKPIHDMPTASNPAVIHPGKPGIILAQSKTFVKGVSLTVFPVGANSSTLKLTLISGTLGKHGFKKNKVIEQKKGGWILFIRHGLLLKKFQK